MSGSRGKHYPAELRERAVRLVGESRPEHGTEWEAMRSVATKLGVGSTETVRTWVRRAEVEAETRGPVIVTSPLRSASCALRTGSCAGPTRS